MAYNLCGAPPLGPPPPSSPAIQTVTRPKALAHHRQPQPRRPTLPPIHPCPPTKVRPHHARLVRIQPSRRSLLGRSSAELAKEFHKTHDATLAGRPKFAAGKYTTYNYSDITCSQYGPYWRQGRRIFPTDLFNPKRLESYESIRREELKVFLRELHVSTNKAIALKDRLSTLGLNMISRMALGKKYLHQKSGQNDVVSPEEFKKMMEELFLLNGVLNIGDFFPWINFLDLQGYIERKKEVS